MLSHANYLQKILDKTMFFSIIKTTFYFYKLKTHTIMDEKKKQGIQPSNNYDPTKHEYYDADTHNVTPYSHRTKVVAQILLVLLIIAFAVLVWHNWKEFANFFI